MILPIYLYGSQVLREKAAEADLEEREELTKLLEDMYETMKNADGCGLAAPQVGRSLRVLIVDGSDLADRYPELADFIRKMINPAFTFKSDEMCTYTEGCLSVPNIDADIERPKVVRINYIDEAFQEKEEDSTALLRGCCNMRWTILTEWSLPTELLRFARKCLEANSTTSPKETSRHLTGSKQTNYSYGSISRL